MSKPKLIPADHAWEYEYMKDRESKPGYFIIDLSADKIYRGLTRAQWADHLRNLNIKSNPKLYHPNLWNIIIRKGREIDFSDLGCTLFLTNANALITDKYAYDAWGNRLSRTGTTEQPYQYVGQYGYYTHYQDTNMGGLLQLGVRFLDPSVGRFTQVDPDWGWTELVWIWRGMSDGSL